MSALAGEEHVQRVALAEVVAHYDHGVQRGWQVEALLGAGRAMPSDGWEGVDECQALVPVGGQQRAVHQPAVDSARWVVTSVPAVSRERSSST